MDPLIWVYIALLLLSVLFCAFYSATETAFACLSKFKFQAKAEDGDKTAALVVKLYDHFDTTLATVLIGNNVFAIVISTVSTFLFLKVFEGSGVSDSLVSTIASVSMAIVVFLFGDTIPKFLGKKIPNRVARFTVWPLSFFLILFFPLSQFFRFLAFVAKKLFRAAPSVEVSEEDFASMIEEGEKQGVFEENESDIIIDALDFDDTSVREIFTPVSKMEMLNVSGLSPEKLRNYLKTCPYSRIPCYVANPNKIIGVLVVKNYLSAYFANPKVPYLDCLQAPYFVSPSVTLDELVEGFREHHTQIALVRKDGKLLGMVTMEDVLEELVGGIAERKEEAAS